MKKVFIFTVWILVSFSMAKESYSKLDIPKGILDICVGKSEGATCWITTPHGYTIDGTCQTTPDKKYFVCKPEGMPSRR